MCIESNVSYEDFVSIDKMVMAEESSFHEIQS